MRAIRRSLPVAAVLAPAMLAVTPAAARPGGWPGLVYYRLHGSPRIYYSAYPPDALNTLAEALRASAEQAIETWCIFDNTAAGAATGDALLSPGATRRLIGDYAARAKQTPAAVRGLAQLTDRERQVLALVAEGLTNTDIAERLVLSPLTAKTHVSRILGKLGARDRAHLVVIAYESGLVQPGWRS